MRACSVTSQRIFSRFEYDVRPTKPVLAGFAIIVVCV